MTPLAANLMARSLLRDALAGAFDMGGQPTPREPDHLYVIQSSSGEVKIGRAVDPVSRLKQLQTGSPHALRLALIVKGAGGYERTVHSRLASIRLRGEWFEAPALPVVRRMFGAES